MEKAAAPLARSMKLLGVLFLTLSAATPASSIFVIVPDVVSQAGTGALISMLLAAAIAVCVGQIYAELSSAFPFAGGEYAMVGRIMGPSLGFAVLALNLANSLLGAAVLALGVSEYLGAVAPGLQPMPVALAVVSVATLLGVLNIRTNAVVTGLFVAVELLALAILTALGALHPARGIGAVLAHPVALVGEGLVGTSIRSIGLAVAVAIFAYDGYGSAVYFGEEMQDAPRRIGRTITWALIIIVVAEVIPLTAVMIGAPNLKAFLSAKAVFSDFVATAGGPVLSQIMGVGIAMAIINAVIAMVLLCARQLYATGRDGIWPEPANTALVALHPNFRSPWAATLISGGLTAALCLMDLKLLLIITGTGVAVIYAVLCIALVVGRRTGATAGARHRAPFATILSAATVLALLGVLWADWLDPVEGRLGLIAALATGLVGILYYVIVVKRKANFALRAPLDAEGF
jgi:amino acid transporter